MKFNRGVTLIELTVVIAVLGVLAAATLISINPDAQNRKTRDAQRKSHIREIQSFLEMYRSDAGEYPATISCNSALVYTPPAPGTAITYTAHMPCDPRNINAGLYMYTTDASRSTYTLGACIEFDQDSDPSVGTDAHGLDMSSCPTPQRFYVVTNP